MKKLLCFSIVILINVLYICQAQSDDYTKWWKIVNEKSESFQNGKIEFNYSYRKKDSINFLEKPFTLIFSKEITYQKKIRKVSKKFNAFNEKDSIQYICNSNCLVTIYHKTKTFELDTLGNYYSRYYYFYSIPRMANYYLENRFYIFIDKESGANNTVYTGDNSITLSYTGQPTFGGGMVSDTYKDSISKILDTGKLSKKQRKELILKKMGVNYQYFYKFSLHDTILISLIEHVENEGIIHDYISAEQRSVLTESDFNNPAYNSNDLYDYRNYTQGYELVLSYNQQVKQNREKLMNEPAPAFELPVIGENRNVKLEDHKGKWVLLDFWFIGCKPCIQLMPEIEKLYNKYHSKGLEILGINIDKNDERLQNFVREKNIPYPMLNTEDRAVSKLYGIIGYPTLILINPQQEVVVISNGINQIEEYLKKSLE